MERRSKSRDVKQGTVPKEAAMTRSADEYRKLSMAYATGEIKEVVAEGRRRHAEKRFRKRLKREAKMQERRDLRAASAKMRDDFGMAIERDDFRERLAEKKAATDGGAA
jgi:hypothetical protein